MIVLLVRLKLLKWKKTLATKKIKKVFPVVRRVKIVPVPYLSPRTFHLFDGLFYLVTVI